MIVFVHRTNGTIDCVSSVILTGYAEEAIDTTAPDAAAYLSAAFAAMTVDLTTMDNQTKALKAVMLVMANWNGKTVPQARQAFTTAWNSLG